MYQSWNNGYGGIGQFGPQQNIGYGNVGQYPNQFGMQPNMGMDRQVRKPNKREIMNWFQAFCGATEMDLVDDFASETKHICQGGKYIEKLKGCFYDLMLETGEVVRLEYFFCPKCKKLILNRNFM